MEPITRIEKLYDAIARGGTIDFEPVTREEMFLYEILKRGGSGGNADQGTGWTTAQIDLLDSLLSHINYTDTEGGAIANQLIASLRGESSGGETEPDEPVEPDEPTADITQSGSVLTIVSGVTVTQTSNVLAIA